MIYHEKLSEYYGQQVFIVGGEDNTSEEIHLFTEFENLIEHLHALSLSSDNDVKVLHGILAPADILPSDLRDKRVYILAFDPYDFDGEGVILDIDEGSTIEELAEEIENVVARGMNVTHVGEMESTYLLYGYELDLCLSVNDEDIDDEIIDTCTHIVEEVELISEANENKFDIKKEKGAV